MISSPVSNAYLYLAIHLAILAMCIGPVGAYIARVYRGQPTFLSPFLSWFEHWLYKVAGVDMRVTQSWKTYALAAVVFSGLGFSALYLLLTFQGVLTTDASHHTPPVSPAQAFSTAAGFVTNANLHAQAGLAVISPLNQMAGLTVQNFLSAAVSLSVFMAVVRGLTRTTPGTIGNFWVDLVRSVLYILLPVSLAYVLLIATAGVGDALEAYAISNFGHAIGSTDIKAVTQTEVLKLTVTNTGSFLNANNVRLSHVATPLTGLLDFLAQWLIPAALCWTFGDMVKDRRQAYLMLSGAVVLLTITLLLVNGLGGAASAIRLLDGNGIILYCLVAIMTVSAAIRRVMFGQSAQFLNHTIGRFDLTMAVTVLLVPTIVLASLLAITTMGSISSVSEAGSLWGLGALVSRFWIMIPALAIAGSFTTSSPSFAGQTTCQQ